MKVYVVSDKIGDIDYQVYGVFDSLEKAKEVMLCEWEFDISLKGSGQLHDKYESYEDFLYDCYDIKLYEMNSVYFYGEKEV